MTITAEQARALRAGITPGVWRVNPENGVCNQIDGDYHAVCTDQFCYAPESEKAANTTAISAVPDMLATIIAQDARIEALEAEKAVAVTLLHAATNLLSEQSEGLKNGLCGSDEPTPEDRAAREDLAEIENLIARIGSFINARAALNGETA